MDIIRIALDNFSLLRVDGGTQLSVSDSFMLVIVLAGVFYFWAKKVFKKKS